MVKPQSNNLRGRLNFLFKVSVLYGGAAAVSKSMALITFPILARYFSPADYGVLDFCMVLAAMLSTLIVFGQDSAVARYFYEYESLEERRQIISQSLVFQLSVVIVLMPLIWIGSKFIETPFSNENFDRWIFLIVLLQIPFMMALNFSQNILKWTFRRNRFIVIAIGNALFYTALIVFSISLYEPDVESVLILSLINSAVFGLTGLFFIRDWLVRPLGFSWVKSLFPYAAPLGIICSVEASVPTLERLFISDGLSPEDLGFYAAGSKIAMFTVILVTAFQTAWGPFSLAIHKSINSIETFNTVLRIFVLLVCSTVILVDISAPLLIKILATDKYLPACVVVFPLSIGLAIQSIGWILELGIVIQKRSYLHLYSTGIYWVCVFLGIWILMPNFGLAGIALGVASAHLIRTFASSWMAQRIHPMKWSYKPSILIVGWTIAMGLVAAVAGDIWGLKYHVLIQCVSFVTILLISWSILLTNTERQMIRSIIARLYIMKSR